ALDGDRGLQLLRLFGPAGNQRQAAVGTEAFGFRQFDGLRADRQVAVVPTLGTRPAALVAAWPGRRGLVGVVQFVGAVPARRFFRLASELLGLQLTVLAPEVFEFLFQFREAS